MTEVKAILPELLNHLFRRLRHDLAEVPMDGLRFSHLRVLSAVPSEGANVTALAESVGMTKQGCGQFVSQLSASGHLETAPDPADGRVRLVQRTPDGDRVLAEVTAASRSPRRGWPTRSVRDATPPSAGSSRSCSTPRPEHAYGGW